jgi:signal transduction histidine kinase
MRMKLRLRLSLRSRIAGAILALVAIAGALLATFAHVAEDRIELSVRYDLLSEELSHYEQRLRVDPGAEPLKSARLRIYRAVDLAELPRQIAILRPGSHYPVRYKDQYYHVLVRDGEFGRLYITYDVTPQLIRERVAVLLLALGVAATVIMAALAAYGVSSRLVGPINRLAAALADIDPRQRNVRIGGEFVGNELEPIGRSVDTFLERLDGFVEREQAFTSTASHELRTPLAVIQGAVELIEEQTREQPPPQKALARVKRAVREMSEFIEALLTLSREDLAPGADADSDVTVILPRVVEDQQAVAGGKQIVMDVDPAPLRVHAPDSMVAMVIGNLVRNALQHGKGEEVVCRIRERELTVTNVGSIAEGNLERAFDRGFTTRPGGHGMGLYLVRRICDRYGWKVALDSTNEGTTAKVEFSAER